LWPTSLGEGLAGSIRVSLSGTLGIGGLVEEPVNRVSSVSKEYNLLRYCNSIIACSIACLRSRRHASQSRRELTHRGLASSRDNLAEGGKIIN